MQDSQQPSQTNNKKLYFGNLPFTMSEEDLGQLVADFGEVVDVKLITDFNTGRSKGFGFVEFAEEEAAQKALEALNETEVDGRAIFVKVARPKQPRENRFGGSNGGGRRDFRRDDRSRE